MAIHEVGLIRQFCSMEEKSFDLERLKARSLNLKQQDLLSVSFPNTKKLDYSIPSGRMIKSQQQSLTIKTRTAVPGLMATFNETNQLNIYT